MALGLAAAGVGKISANDPQLLEAENIGPTVYTRSTDIGREKVFALEQFFHGRPDLEFLPVPVPTESSEVDKYFEQSQLVLSCANSVSARMVANDKAIKYGKPVMQVASFDGRDRLAAMIFIRLPENDWSACFGCLLAAHQSFSRGEGLLTSVTSVAAAMASNMAVQLLTDFRSECVRTNNLFFIDQESYNIEALAVNRLAECKLCGPGRTEKTAALEA